MAAFVGSAKTYRKGSDYLNDNNYDTTKYLPPYVTKDGCLYERKSGTEIKSAAIRIIETIFFIIF